MGLSIVIYKTEKSLEQGACKRKIISVLGHVLKRLLVWANHHVHAIALSCQAVREKLLGTFAPLPSLDDPCREKRGESRILAR